MIGVVREWPDITESWVTAALLWREAGETGEETGNTRQLEVLR